jgi:hypothetical protein
MFISKRLVYIFSFSFLIAWIYLIFFFQDPSSQCNSRATFTGLIEGKAYRPYVFRRFLPDISKNLDLLTPNFIAKHLKKNLSNFIGEKLIGKSGRDWILAYFYANIISLISLILSAIYIKKLGYFLKIPEEFVSLIFLFSLVIFLNFRYIYDFVTLFLFIICIFNIIKNKNFFYLFFFTLSTYNKETSLFLILFYAFLNPFKTKSSKIMILLQFLIYFSIRFSIYINYRNNPGFTISPHFDLAIGNILSPFKIESFFSYILIFILIFAKFKEKPVWVKKGLILFPIYLILYFLFGVPSEIRVFLDIYPIIFLSCLHSIEELLNYLFFSKKES